MPFPNLYLIGAPKAGTTFIYAHLAAAPEIFTPRSKEPFLFIYKGFDESVHRHARLKLPAVSSSEEAYLSYFSEWKDETYAIDASTRYLSFPQTAQSIQAVRPDARIIAVLREPIERAHSHYLMELRDGYVREDFEQALGYEREEMKFPETPWAGHYNFVRESRYRAGLNAYLSSFGPERVRVYHYKDIGRRLGAVLNDLSIFLGIEPLQEVSAEKSRNAFAKDRFPVLTSLMLSYRYSPLRDVANKIFPRKMRDAVRLGLRRAARKESEKPTISPQARAFLENALGDDYTATLADARAAGVIFE